jgi:thioredoxin reductase (NADPH)
MDEDEVVVIGAGVAGLTAALFSARYGRKTVVIDQMGMGGQILNVHRIDNYPGFPEGVGGFDLGPRIQEQAEAAGAEFAFDEVVGLERHGDRFLVRCADADRTARAVIVAAGSSFRTLGIPGEEEFLGRGVSHCASCDGSFFIDQEVCVVGGGDSAFDEAVVLAEYASNITVYYRGETPRAQKAVLDAARATPKIAVETNTLVEALLGDDGVSGVRLRDSKTGATRERALKGVFIFAGLDPNTAFLQGVVDLDPAGHIVTDVCMRTSLPGVFAAGDIRQHSVAQLAAAAGDGATAAITAHRWLAGQ